MEEKYKIHAFYILLILFLIIICLVTVKWAKIPGLADYITFALTVTSIALAILAIVYTMYANSALSQNISSIESSSKELSILSPVLSESTKNLSKKVDEIPMIIKSVGEKVDATHKMVSTIAIEKGSMGDDKVLKIKEIGEDIINHFLIRSSFNGILSLYACKLSLEKKFPFKLKELVEKMEYASFDYFYGYLVASRAFGIVIYDEKKDIFSIEHINEYLAKNLAKGLDERIKKMLEDSPSLERETFEKDIAFINAYFEI